MRKLKKKYNVTMVTAFLVFSYAMQLHHIYSSLCYLRVGEAPEVSE